MNKYTLFIVILLIMGNAIFCDFNYNEYWYNPEGWKIPDINKFEKIGEERILVFEDINGTIIIEDYSKKNAEKYYLFEKQGDKNFVVYLNREIRYEINNFSIVKLLREKNEQVLLYVIDYFDQEEIVQNLNGKIVTVYGGGGLSIGVLIDMNNDSKFEILYSGMSCLDLDPINRIKTLATYKYNKLSASAK